MLAVNRKCQYLRENVLMYLDPPYLAHTRKQKRLYTHEMDEAGHTRLCWLISNSPAHIILSGYANGMYDSLLLHWHKQEAYAFDESGEKRTEVLWMNYRAEAELFDCEEAAV